MMATKGRRSVTHNRVGHQPDSALDNETKNKM